MDVELYNIIKKGLDAAYQADDLARIQKYSSALHKLTAEPMQIDAPTQVERIGRGAADVTQGISQLARHVLPGDPTEWEKSKKEEFDLYNKGRGEAGFDWTRLVGGSLALAPLILASGGTVGANAMLGATGAASTYAPGDNFWSNKALQTGTGAAFGAAFPWLLGKGAEGVRGGYNAIKNMTNDKVLQASIQMTDDAMSGVRAPQDVKDAVKAALLKEVQSLLKAGKQVDPESLARKARLKAGGYSPTMGQVTRDAATWQNERDWAKIQDIGGELRDRFISQNQQLKSNASQIADQFGPEMELYTVGRNVIDAAGDIGRSSQKAVSKAYEQAIENPGIGDEIVDVKSMRNALTEIYTTFDDFIPPSVKKRLTELVDGSKSPTVTNVEQAGRIVSILRGTERGSAGEALKRISKVLTDAIDDTGAAGGESAAALRKATELAAKRFGMIDGRGQQNTNLIKGLIENKVNADTFVKNNIMAGKTDDIISLKNFLTNMPKELESADGTIAWNAIRSSVVRELMNAGGLNKTLFNGKTLENAWNRLGSRRNALFNSDENMVINGLIQAAKDLTNEPAYTNQNYSGSATTAINFLLKVSKIGVVGDLAKSILGTAMRGRNVNVSLSGRLLSPSAPKLPPPSIHPGFAIGSGMLGEQTLNSLLYQ